METTQQTGKQSPDNRKHVRCQIDYDPMPIIDLGTASSLGQVENITVGGCLLKSEQPTMLDQVFSVSMSVPGQHVEKSVIRCSARSLWSCPAEILPEQGNQMPGNFLTGYEFLGISETEAEIIEDLIAILGRISN